MVNADRGEEHGALDDAIDAAGRASARSNPTPARLEVLTINELVAVAPHLEWLTDLKMRRRVGKQLGDCGYVAIDNPDVHSGLWTVGGRRQRIYARDDLSLADRLTAARKLAGAPSKTDRDGV